MDGEHNSKLSGENGSENKCKMCDYVAVNSDVLQLHIEFHYSRQREAQQQRQKRRYPCDQCEYVATFVSNLKKHKKINHEGVRYPCDLSEYAATAISSLKHHKEAKHEGIKYPCDKYEFVPSNKLHLKRHKESKHEGLRYSCDPRINDCAEIKMKNVSVMVEKLNVSKYQSLLKNVKLEQKVLKKETNRNGMFAEMKDYSNEIPNDGNKDTCDLQTKIEIEEDLTIKAESSDLSEFLLPRSFL